MELRVCLYEKAAEVHGGVGRAELDRAEIHGGVAHEFATQRGRGVSGMAARQIDQFQSRSRDRQSSSRVDDVVLQMDFVDQESSARRAGAQQQGQTREGQDGEASGRVHCYTWFERSPDLRITTIESAHIGPTKTRWTIRVACSATHVGWHANSRRARGLQKKVLSPVYVPW